MAGIKGFNEIQISESEWGPLSILRPLPRDGDSWGLLRGARDTEWEPFIKVVSGEAFSYALHGYTKFLVDQIGKDPRTVARGVPDHVGLCRSFKNKTCPIRQKYCRPGPEVPECYEPDVEDFGLEEALYEVVMAWKVGRYVLVIEGSEFSF